MKKASLAFIAFSLSADTLELKTGERMDGNFKQATSAGVVIEVASQSLTIPLEKVRAIYFGTPTASISSPFATALEALKELQSVTASGVALHDYAPRVLDARIKMDKYIALGTDDSGRASMRLAMRYFELASTVWPLNLTPISAWSSQMFEQEKNLERALRQEQGLSACPIIAAILASADALNAKNAQLASAEQQKPARKQNSSVIHSATVDHLAVWMMLHPPQLWACASANLAAAEAASK